MLVSELEKKPDSTIKQANIPNNRPKGMSFKEVVACVVHENGIFTQKSSGCNRFEAWLNRESGSGVGEQYFEYKFATKVRQHQD